MQFDGGVSVGEAPTCPECSSGDTYFSRKRGSWVCEDCGVSFTPSTPAPRGQKLFFSYGHDANTPIVRRLKTDLESRGHSVWLDSEGIRAGQDWRDSITAGIANSDRVVSFLSRHSVRSPGVCLDELRIALATKSGAIQSVLLEAEDTVTVPASVSHIQWLDMSTWSELAERDPEAFEAWYGHRLRELCEIVESTDATVFAGDITFLRTRLAPRLADTKERHLLRQPFVGRAWLLDRVRAWHDDPSGSRAFVLLGGPGLGKSRIAAELLHRDPAVACGVFLEWGKGLATATAVTRTLAFKLATRLPDYRRLLVAQLGDATAEDLDAMGDAALFNQLLVYPLSQLVDGGRPPLVIVIDGLDEAATVGGNPLARSLAANLQQLPDWVRVLITSRPEAEVPVLLDPFGPFVLAPDDTENQQDIRQYLAEGLRASLLSSGQPHFTLERLVRACQGNFLHATLVMDAVNTLRMKVEHATSLPPGLDAFYHADLQSRFRTGGRWPYVRQLLELVLAVHPIPLALVKNALGADTYDLHELRASLGSLVQEVQIPSGVAQTDGLGFSHKSIPEWLSDPSRSVQFHVDAAHGHDRLATHLLQALGSPESRQPSDDPLGQFMQGSLGDVLAASARWSELEEFLLDDGTPLWPYWRSVDAFPAGWDRTQLLRRLRDHPERDGFLKELQRRGDPLVLNVIQGIEAAWGAASLDLPLVNLYIDTVHLHGGYRHAVALCDAHLHGRLVDELAQDPELLRIAVRRLHHQMFYLPVPPLLADAHRLLAAAEQAGDDDVVKELLFLVGGNLGLLSGEPARALPWLTRARRVATETADLDLEQRALRKVADIMCLEGRYGEALAAVGPTVTPERGATTRYQVYLLGLLGEVHRHLGHAAAAIACYEATERESVRRGIRGWQAHAHLGTAALLVDLGDRDGAKEACRRAAKIYEDIDQAWGRISARIVGARIDLLDDDPGSALPLLRRVRTEANALGYRYETAVIDRILAHGQDPSHHLLFL